MRADATAPPARATDEWSLARRFLAASAVYHLVLGIAGLALDQTFPVGSEATTHASSEHVFGVFETNGWHSLAGILIGVISVYFTVRPERARQAALALGVSQLLVVVAFALLPPSTFWFASNGADQIIHTATAVGGIGSGLLTRPASSRVRARS